MIGGLHIDVMSGKTALMSRSRLLVMSLALGCALISGCGSGSSAGAASGKLTPTEMSKKVTNGMSRSELEAMFGKPTGDHAGKNGRVLLNWDVGYGGLLVTLQDDKVIYCFAADPDEIMKQQKAKEGSE
jgi:hypothetical protein